VTRAPHARQPLPPTARAGARTDATPSTASAAALLCIAQPISSMSFRGAAGLRERARVATATPPPAPSKGQRSPRREGAGLVPL
jgi:hypothetical protein